MENVRCQAHISKDSSTTATKGNRYTKIEYYRYWVRGYRRCQALACQVLTGAPTQQRNKPGPYEISLLMAQQPLLSANPLRDGVLDYQNTVARNGHTRGSSSFRVYSTISSATISTSFTDAYSARSRRRQHFPFRMVPVEDRCPRHRDSGGDGSITGLTPRLGYVAASSISRTETVKGLLPRKIHKG